MHSGRFYYCEPGESPRGPLPIEEIRAEVAAGRLSGDVNLSTTPLGEWQKLTSINFHNLKIARARAARRRSVAIAILTVLAVSGLCVWIYLEKSKETASGSDSLSVTDDRPEEERQQLSEEKVTVIAGNCLTYLHLNMETEKSNESMRISLTKKLTVDEARIKADEYQKAKIKAEKLWDDFQDAMERLRTEETAIGSIGRYSKALSDCKDYGIRLAISAAKASTGEKPTTNQALDEYEKFRNFTLEDVLAGKYHGGYGEPEAK